MCRRSSCGGRALFRRTEIQSLRRSSYRCRRKYAARSQLRRMRIPGLPGIGRCAGRQRRPVVAVLYGRRRRDDEEDCRISGKNRSGKRTGSRCRSVQRQLRKAPSDQYIRRRRFLCDRGGPVRRGNGMLVRLPRRRRLRVGLRFRSLVDRSAKRVACRERSALHRLRCLRQGLSQRHYRAS